MYRVKVSFQDLEDNRHQYHAGDIFPRQGLEVSEARLHTLLTGENRRKLKIIEEVSDDGSESSAQSPRKRGRKRNVDGTMPGIEELVQSEPTHLEG